MSARERRESRLLLQDRSHHQYIKITPRSSLCLMKDATMMNIGKISLDKLERALESYQSGSITLWKAARMADISLWTIIDLLQERRIELRYGLQELRQEFQPLAGK